MTAFRKLRRKEVQEKQDWAKEEFFRQQNTGGRAYFINWLWHPVVRIRFCKFVTDEAVEEMP